MYKIFFEKRVLKFLEKHETEKIITQFKKSIEKLKQNPYDNTLDIKSLRGLDGKYRLIIGDYRFIYEINDKEVVIIFIYAGNRGDIYKKV